jgi:hypothetical protein
MQAVTAIIALAFAVEREPRRWLPLLIVLGVAAVLLLGLWRFVAGLVDLVLLGLTS